MIKIYDGNLAIKLLCTIRDNHVYGDGDKILYTI